MRPTLVHRKKPKLYCLHIALKPRRSVPSCAKSGSRKRKGKNRVLRRPPRRTRNPRQRNPSEKRCRSHNSLRLASHGAVQNFILSSLGNGRIVAPFWRPRPPIPRDSGLIPTSCCRRPQGVYRHWNEKRSDLDQRRFHGYRAGTQFETSSSGNAYCHEMAHTRLRSSSVTSTHPRPLIHAPIGCDHHSIYWLFMDVEREHHMDPRIG